MSSLSPVPILIAENIGPARKFLGKLLAAEGYPVLEAPNGASALAFLRHVTTPLVALIEWDLPDHSGIEICRQVREENIDHRLLILLTSRNAREDLSLLEDSGADDCLFRPYTREEFLAKVRIAVEIMALEGALVLGVEELKEAVAKVRELGTLQTAQAHCEGRKGWVKWRGGLGMAWRLRRRFGREAG